MVVLPLCFGFLIIKIADKPLRTRGKRITVLAPIELMLTIFSIIFVFGVTSRVGGHQPGCNPPQESP